MCHLKLWAPGPVFAELNEGKRDRCQVRLGAAGGMKTKQQKSTSNTGGLKVGGKVCRDTRCHTEAHTGARHGGLVLCS